MGLHELLDFGRDLWPLPAQCCKPIFGTFFVNLVVSRVRPAVFIAAGDG